MKITLKAARVNAGYTQKSASQRLGVNRLTLLNWEQGKTYPTISKFAEMCRLYNTSLNDIILPERGAAERGSADAGEERSKA